MFPGARDWLDGALEFSGEVRAVSAVVPADRFDDEDSRVGGAAAAGSASEVLEARDSWEEWSSED